MQCIKCIYVFINSMSCQNKLCTKQTGSLALNIKSRSRLFLENIPQANRSSRMNPEAEKCNAGIKKWSHCTKVVSVIMIVSSVIQEYMRVCKNYQLWLVKNAKGSGCARVLHDREHFNYHFSQGVLKSFSYVVCRTVKIEGSLSS